MTKLDDKDLEKASGGNLIAENTELKGFNPEPPDPGPIFPGDPDDPVAVGGGGPNGTIQQN